VFFKNPRHALEALARGPRRTDAPEFAVNVQSEVDTSVTYEGEENELEDAIHQPEADASRLVVLSDLVEALPSAVTPLALESIAEEQKAVAKKLLAGYRRSLKTREMENAKTRTQKLCDSFYFACLNLSQTMDWVGHTFYKKLYLGPIPHLLTCVGVVQPYAQAAKKKALPRLLDESERDIEGLKRELDDLRYHFLALAPLVHEMLTRLTQRHPQVLHKYSEAARPVFLVAQGTQHRETEAVGQGGTRTSQSRSLWSWPRCSIPSRHRNQGHRHREESTQAQPEARVEC
jgi:hypothetical protein